MPVTRFGNFAQASNLHDEAEVKATPSRDPPRLAPSRTTMSAGRPVPMEPGSTFPNYMRVAPHHDSDEDTARLLLEELRAIRQQNVSLETQNQQFQNQNNLMLETMQKKIGQLETRSAVKDENDVWDFIDNNWIKLLNAYPEDQFMKDFVDENRKKATLLKEFGFEKGKTLLTAKDTDINTLRMLKTFSDTLTENFSKLTNKSNRNRPLVKQGDVSTPLTSESKTNIQKPACHRCGRRNHLQKDCRARFHQLGHQLTDEPPASVRPQQQPQPQQ